MIQHVDQIHQICRRFSALREDIIASAVAVRESVELGPRRILKVHSLTRELEGWFITCAMITDFKQLRVTTSGQDALIRKPSII